MFPSTETGGMRAPEPVSANGHCVEAEDFRSSLVSWGRENFRRLPWRETRDLYEILVAEVMLHRTKAPQVLPVYRHFLQRYPTVEKLAGATRDDLHAALYSLGLRQRVDMFHDMAVEIMERFDGQVPAERGALLSLPGVSDYIAGAVRCFSLNEPEPLIDTNTVRVIGRVFGLKITDSSRRNRLFKDLITALVDPDEPRAYNYALLDLANLVCTKVRPPRCNECPVRRYCLYGLSPSTAKSAESDRHR
jgi:A/G-specific adenine glycosylase